MVNAARNDQTIDAPSRVEIYALINYSPAAAPCGGKANRSREDALAAAAAHNRRFVCGDMEAYPCARHRAWHIGHANFRRRKNLQFRRDYAWFELWAAGRVGRAA